uniref:hypothetical protein n=1 Tax=Candidatus Nitrotoga sp. 1052 TaxID=2886964 RepID=UPI001EF5F06A|nr:hypothetical protein [Candidatus Nitrotoga sp. 1052]
MSGTPDEEAGARRVLSADVHPARRIQGTNLCAPERRLRFAHAVLLGDGAYLQPERQTALGHARRHSSVAYEHAPAGLSPPMFILLCLE